MSSKLFIYDIKSLKKLTDKMSKYTFFSISHFFLTYPSLNDLKNIDLDFFDNCVVDLTNLAREHSYFKIFVEQYILKLQRKCSNIHFCLQEKYEPDFLCTYPHVFTEENINRDFALEETPGIPDEIVEKKLKFHSPLVLCTYNDVKKLSAKYKIQPLSGLMDESEGIIFRYSIEKIKQVISDTGIDLIDISSLVNLVKLRSDQIFQFEILLILISQSKECGLCVSENLKDDTIRMFPLIFSEVSCLDPVNEESTGEEAETKKVDIKQIEKNVDDICNALRGHDNFKSDFKQSFLKFSFLNEMGERRILSIILCGDSGIGKTEFAKIASKIIYPGESLIKINFGNYSTEGVLNSLIGSPLGYVGSEEGGELINKISTSKSKVILIDEFEKATPGVFNFFYELLEDGKFTDRHGTEHDLNGYIIVFTSNMTMEQYKKLIPDSLKSRFDLVYYFVELPITDKLQYINQTAASLVTKLHSQFGVLVDIDSIHEQLGNLAKLRNLRDIKRSVEDLVFNAFYENYLANEE